MQDLDQSLDTDNLGRGGVQLLADADFKRLNDFGAVANDGAASAIDDYVARCRLQISFVVNPNRVRARAKIPETASLPRLGAESNCSLGSGPVY